MGIAMDKQVSDSLTYYGVARTFKGSSHTVYYSVFGITVGAHRLWSHRSFEASFTVRLLLVLCNSIANHRLHHKYRGTDADPHNISWGSFFAHMGWFLVEKHPCTARVDVSDLEEDSLVAAQHKLFNPSSLYMCFIMPAQVASRCWDEDFGTALLVCGVLRYVMVLHCSCWINSRGSAPRREKSRYYLFDYAASEFGIKYDPSTMLFDLLALTGLVWGRRRVSERRRRRRDVIVVKGIPPPREIAFKKLETSNEFDLWTFEGTSD